MLNKSLLQNILAIFLLGFLTFVISHKVLPINGGISYNDASYSWNIENKIDSIISSYSSDYLGTSLLNGISLYTPKGILTVILKTIGLSDFWTSYILSFGFIFLVATIGFFIFSKISNSKIFGFSGSAFIIFNNISIEYIAFGQYYFYLYLLAIILLINISFRIYKNGFNVEYIDILKLAALSLIVILPLNLVGYSICIFIFFIFFYIKSGYKKELLLKGILTGLIIFILNLYWIIPFLIGVTSAESGSVYSGNANGVLGGFSKMATYINIISFRQYFNIISSQLFDSVFVNIFYISLVGIIFVIGIFSKIKERGFILLLLIIYLTFFNFALGPNSSITGGTYRFLWENYGFFSFFRSFTRFSIPLLAIIIFIIAIYISNIKSNTKKNYNILSFIFLFLILGLHYPLITGNLKDIIIAIDIPAEYKDLNTILGKDVTIISYPNPSYETYSWSIGNSKIQLEDYFLKEYIINSPVLYNRASLNLENKNSFYNFIFSENFEGNNLSKILKLNSIEYVLVQKSLVNVFNGESIKYTHYLEYFNKNSNKILDNPEFSLFYLGKGKEKVSFNISKDWKYKKIASYLYTYKANFKNTSSIDFLENFNPNWQLYLEPYSEIDCKNPNTYSGSLNQKTENYTIQAGDDYQKIVASQSGITLDILRELNPEIDERELKIGQVITLKKTAGESYSVTECESENRFYVGGELSKLWEKPIFDDTHTMIYDYANQWIIDPAYIKANYSKEYYRENPDGSIDVRMTLYFKPQSYFYLGLMISAATLIFLLSYLGYDAVKNRRQRNPKK